MNSKVAVVLVPLAGADVILASGGSDDELDVLPLADVPELVDGPDGEEVVAEAEVLVRLAGGARRGRAGLPGCAGLNLPSSQQWKVAPARRS